MNKEVITLFDFTKQYNQVNFFPFYAGLWGIKTDEEYEGVLYDVTIPERLTDEAYYNVLTVSLIENATTEPTKITFTKVDTIPLAISTDTSFYEEDNLLLIHFPDFNSPYEYSGTDDILQLGATLGFFNSTARNELTLDTVVYDNRLSSVPNAKTKKDNLLFGKQTYDSASVIIDNSDGEYDNYVFGRKSDTKEEVLPKIGWYGRLRKAIVEPGATVTESDFFTYFQGYSESIAEQVTSGSGIGVRFKFRDVRKNLTQQICTRYLDTSLYPYLSEDDADTTIYLPHLWGSSVSMPVKCLNPDETSVVSHNFIFLMGDATDDQWGAITGVYINGVSTGLTPTFSYTTQSDGSIIVTFNIISTEFETRGDVNNVTIACTGIGSPLTPSALDVASSIINIATGSEYTNIYYNTTEWDSVKANAPDIKLYYDEPTEIYKLLEIIQKSFVNTEFQIEKDTLKYTWNDYDYSGLSDVQIEITPDLFLPTGYIINPVPDSTNIAAKVKILFNENERTETFIEEIDDSNQSDAIIKYNSTQVLPPDYETNIRFLAGAKEAVARMVKILFYPDTRFTLEIPLTYIDTSGTKVAELESGQFIKVLANTPTKILYGYLVCEIMTTEQNDANLTLKLNLRVQYTETTNYKQPTAIVSSATGKYFGSGGDYGFVFTGIY